MPLPLLLPVAVITISSLPGVAAAVKGQRKQEAAKRTVKENERALAATEDLLSLRQSQLEDALTSLGKTKLICLETGLLPFHEAYGRFRNVELTDAPETEVGLPIDNQEVLSAGELDLTTSEVVQGAGLVGLAGAAGYAGAVSGTGIAAATATLGAAGATASTGTAIAGLSGAAASNAALASLGGGSIAAGGGGIAAGTAVLGTTVAAPMISTVGGFYLYRKGRQAEAKADAHTSRVGSERARLLIGVAGTEAGKSVADSVSAMLQLLQPELTRCTERIRQIADRETDWSVLDESEKDAIHRSAVFASAASSLVHTAIFGDNGMITLGIQRAIQRGETLLGSSG